MKSEIIGISLTATLAGSLTPLSASEPATQPALRTQFINHERWPDNNGVHINAHGGGVLFHDGTYYWFGEHKIAGEAGNIAHVGVRCFSSTDLYNWTDAGVALPVSEDPTSDIAKECIIERPKVIYNQQTKKFVMWFHLELKGQGYSAARTAVAVADQPTGPFEYLHSLRPNAGAWPLNVTEADQQPGPKNFLQRDFAGGQMARDMTLFLDDDGKAYHIAASEENETLHISELSEDYLSFTGRYIRVFPGKSHEAPAICKHNGRYWMLSSGCSGWAPNAARSAVADSMLGSWTELGNPCVGTNPHNNLGPDKTFGGQSTHIFQVAGQSKLLIAMFDIWSPEDAIDGRHIWLPITFTDDALKIEWASEWKLPGTPQTSE